MKGETTRIQSVFYHIVRLSLGIAILSGLGFRPAQAELKMGDEFPEFEAQDQHEKPFSLGDGVDYLLFSFDMPTGKKANKYLERKGAAFLLQNKAVYVANIDGMPWIGRKFAIPKMQKYPHRIVLADTEHASILKRLPRQEGKVTLLKLDSRHKILKISFWDPTRENPEF